MTPIKKHIIYTFLTTFVLVTCVGLFVALRDGPVVGIVIAAFAQCAAVIIGAIKAPEYFSDPQAVSKLKSEQADAIAKIKHDHAEAMRQKDAQLESQAKSHALQLQSKDLEIKNLNTGIAGMIEAASLPPGVARFTPGAR